MIDDRITKPRLHGSSVTATDSRLAFFAMQVIGMASNALGRSCMLSYVGAGLRITTELTRSVSDLCSRRLGHEPGMSWPV